MENTEKARPLLNCLGLVVKRHFCSLSTGEDDVHSPTLMQGAGKCNLTVCPGKGHFGEHLARFFHRRKGDAGVKIWKMKMNSPGKSILRRWSGKCNDPEVETAWNT